MSLILTPGAIASLDTTPAAITTAETLVLAGKLPANTLKTGTTFEIISFGTISATTAGTLLARLRAGTAGTTADTQVCASTATGSATAAVGWHIEGLFSVRASGNVIGNLEIGVGANTTGRTAQTATVGPLTLTVDNFLDLTLIGGGTAPSITVVQAVIICSKV